MKWYSAGALALAGLVTLIAPATASAQSGRRLYVDDFREGISIGTPGVAPWYYFTVPPFPPFAFVGDDGVATGGRRGLHVEPAGRNPTTGEPAFTRTVPQETGPFSVPGGVDHVKWLVYSGHIASSGIPGHDIVPGRETVCSVRGFGGRTYGTAAHPFGSNVLNANDDLRLAAFAMNSIDLESFMVADWFVTNEQIYVFYERLPFGRSATNNYAAFSFQIPVGRHRPGQRHNLQTAWSQTYIRWLLDGREVYRVSRVGALIDRRLMTLDHGGTPSIVVPRQVDCGMGTFTLLDAHRPSTVGLVRLSTAADFYFDPDLGAPVAETFFDGASLAGSRLWGQGASLDVRRYVILDRPARLLACDEGDSDDSDDRNDRD